MEDKRKALQAKFESKIAVQTSAVEACKSQYETVKDKLEYTNEKFKRKMVECKIDYMERLGQKWLEQINKIDSQITDRFNAWKCSERKLEALNALYKLKLDLLEK